MESSSDSPSSQNYKDVVKEVSRDKRIEITRMMIDEDISPREMSQLSGMNINTLKKYKKLMKKGVTIAKGTTLEPALDPESDKVIRNLCQNNTVQTRTQLEGYLDQCYRDTMLKKRKKSDLNSLNDVSMPDKTKRRYVSKYKELISCYSDNKVDGRRKGGRAPAADNNLMITTVPNSISESTTV